MQISDSPISHAPNDDHAINYGVIGPGWIYPLLQKTNFAKPLITTNTKGFRAKRRWEGEGVRGVAFRSGQYECARVAVTASLTIPSDGISIYKPGIYTESNEF